MDENDIERFPLFVRHVQTYQDQQRYEESKRRCAFLVSVKQIFLLCLAAFLMGILFPTVMMYWSNFSQDTQQQQISDTLHRNKNNILESSRRQHGTIAKSTSPNIAWLMSFPNSGTSYTMELVMVASNMSTATNYAWEQEGIGYTGKEMPVPLERNAFNTSIDKISGPFWTLPQLSASYKSSDAVLTKTHCGGYCHDCRPYKYVETPHSFLMHCATSEMEYLRDDGKKKTKYVIYDYNKIVRAVHLIRNPFDNMVSRYHLGRHKKLKTNRTVWIEKYTEDRSGFEKFCSDITHTSSEHSSTFIDQAVLQLINDIPCHLDLFRYIQWHNLAFLITDEWLQIPTHILHYEDYTSNFTNTVQDLLNFLQLPNTGAYETFMRGKSYHEYFTDDQRLRMRNATLQLASPQTWHYVERYFPS